LVERRYLLAAAVTVAAYYAAAQIGIHLAYPHTGTSTYGVVTAFWPPVGVGIAALVLFGLRLWPAVVIGDLLAGDYSTPLGVTLGQTLGTVVAVVVSAALLIRLGARRPGLRVRDVLVLMASTAAGTALGAGLGVLAIWVAGDLPSLGAERIWRTWWLSDLAGALVVTPAVLTWANTRVRLTRRQMAEGAALILVLLGLTDLASHHDVPYVIFPALIWAALRFGPRGAAAALLAASLITIWDTSNGTGPFVRSSLTDSLLATQLFVGVAALTSMILAAVTAERAASEAAARGLAREQAALRRIATLLVSEADPARIFGAVMREAALALASTRRRSCATTRRAPSASWGLEQDGELLFPAGSVIEIGEEGSALVEVYRTGEARRVSYPRMPAVSSPISVRAATARASLLPSACRGLWGALVASSVDEPAAGRSAAPLVRRPVAQALANATRTQLAAARAHRRRRRRRAPPPGAHLMTAQQRLVSLALQPD
jgi:integral membrane sensor domain MASE1